MQEWTCNYIFNALVILMSPNCYIMLADTGLPTLIARIGRFNIIDTDPAMRELVSIEAVNNFHNHIIVRRKEAPGLGDDAAYVDFGLPSW